ncbi:N-acetyltransferase [Curtobacterium sp. ISL-83]|uniref:GNAT family N-acetyltransferase n=1 Tax=Curtobacterium sp. ISL-83 TaxID=2819145 RepID=UPI001BECB18F|nr:GNAT family N-acetyltransferase [Curtobacterium sp. ISL-83]MBT2504269.1 GNAT family N-acetyltransferase [Curtobacterium sp. ISL-83]
MSIAVSKPVLEDLDDVVQTLATWQRDDVPLQLHPGDLGWHWRHGSAAVARDLRVWRESGRIVSMGFLDGPEVLRMTVAPERWSDADLASRIRADVTEGSAEILSGEKISVEAPNGSALQEAFRSAGWAAGEAWTPLSRSLERPVELPGLLRVEVVGSGASSAFTAVHRSAWNNPNFTDSAWSVMAATTVFTSARCLLGRDRDGVPVAGVIVWSSGKGRPGLLEPMGVRAEYRGLGYGTAICLAAAAALQNMGSSTASVCTPSALLSAVATYRSAGFVPMAERFDCVR